MLKFGHKNFLILLDTICFYIATHHITDKWFQTEPDFDQAMVRHCCQIEGFLNTTISE